eukprot:3236787-Amphidinium_carterae.1
MIVRTVLLPSQCLPSPLAVRLPQDCSTHHEAGKGFASNGRTAEKCYPDIASCCGRWGGRHLCVMTTAHTKL